MRKSDPLQGILFTGKQPVLLEQQARSRAQNQPVRQKRLDKAAMFYNALDVVKPRIGRLNRRKVTQDIEPDQPRSNVLSLTVIDYEDLEEKKK